MVKQRFKFALASLLLFLFIAKATATSPTFYSFSPPKEKKSTNENEVVETAPQTEHKEKKTQIYSFGQNTNKSSQPIHEALEKKEQSSDETVSDNALHPLEDVSAPSLDPHSFSVEDLIGQAPLVISPEEQKDEKIEELEKKAGIVSPEQAVAPQQEPELIDEEEEDQTILINFNNVQIVELLRFISRISNKNFVFDEKDMNFNVTIISEEPTTIENILTALYQELRIHDLELIEQGNNMIIHKNPKVNSISRVVSDTLQDQAKAKDTEIVTRVFRLNTLDPQKAAQVVKPLVSIQAIVEPVSDPNNIIITDLVTNIDQVNRLLKSLDSPNSGLVIGQYVIKNMPINSLQSITEEIMLPIAQGQTLTFVPHSEARSLFVISSPYLVERTLAIMQYVDQKQGATRIHDIEQLREVPSVDQKGRWRLDKDGNWVFTPDSTLERDTAPDGQWMVDREGNWFFVPDGTVPTSALLERSTPPPKGRWVQDADGKWNFQLSPGESISAEALRYEPEVSKELPIGAIERTRFLLHKLQNRRGDEIVDALEKIASSMQACGDVNEDLICTLNSVQWIISSNSLIFTGTLDALDKVKELIDEVDAPVRQVFLEMLILETTLDDSLTYGVNWGTRFGGGTDIAGSQAFLTAGTPLTAALDTTGSNSIPEASGLSRNSGFNQGVIGQTLTKDGQFFRSIGYLIRAIHSRADTRIVLNPKIIVEDNQEAEIFVGINTRFRTQSIANEFGGLVTQNFEFRDIGTTLRITPMIANNNVITLDIFQESSSDLGGGSGGGTGGGGGGGAAQTIADEEIGPTTRVNKTITRVHVPNKYFLVISGMLQDQNTIRRTQVPCLGGVPILGGLFAERDRDDQRRNLMIFIRPQIVDTIEELQTLTKHQQDIYEQRSKTKKSWKYGVEEALDFLNVPGVCRPWCLDEKAPQE